MNVRLKTVGFLSVAMLVVLASAEMARGQTLLERLEKRLQGAIAPADPAAPPATTGEPTPAKPMPADGATDELPAPMPSGYLGLTGDDSLEDGKGVRVVVVKIGSPAARAGLEVGDLITAIGDEPVPTVDVMHQLLSGLPVGAKVDFKIDRNRKVQTVAVTLGERPATPDIEVGEETPSLRPFSAEASRASLGVSVIPLTEELRERYDLSIRRGAFIAQVRPGSPADTAGLPVGGVIVAIDGRRIDTADELVGIIAASRPGNMVELTYYQGATLARKSVRLASAGPAAAAPGSPAAGAPLAGDRPVIRRVEQLLQQFTQPGAAPGGDPGFVPGGDPGFVGPPAMEGAAAMEAEIAELKDRVRLLEAKLADLEAKMSGAPATETKKPTSDDPLLLEPPAKPKNQLP